MSFLDRIKSKLYKKEEKKLLKGLDEVKETFEEAKEETDTKNEAIKVAANRALEQIKAHPDMSAIDFLKLIEEEEELPTAIVGEVALEIPKEMSENEVVETVKQLDLGASIIQEIIKEADVSLKTEQFLVNEIPDNEIKKAEQEKLRQRKEKKNLERIQKLYETCTQISDPQLIDKIQEINISEKTNQIQNKLIQLIAKKTAHDCMEYGGPKVPTMAQIIPVDQMLEINFHNIVEKEYEILKSEYEKKGQKYHIYNPNELKNKIIENIGKEIAKSYEATGDINVPQSEQMKKLKSEEEELLIESIEKACKEEKITEKERIKIRRQIKGEITTEIEDLVNMFEKLPNEQMEDYLNRFRSQLQERTKKTEEEQIAELAIDRLNLKLRTLSPKECTKVVNVMISTLEEREQAKQLISKNTSKISKNDEEISL